MNKTTLLKNINLNIQHLIKRYKTKNYKFMDQTEEELKNPIERAIKNTLTKNLNPIHLEVVNESYMHNVPKGSESHFKLLIVSNKFEGLPLIKRHRLVNNLVKEELGGNFVHALSIEAKTSSQWSSDYVLNPSPNCRGGFGK